MTQTKTMVDVQAKGGTGHVQFNDGAKHCTISYKAAQRGRQDDALEERGC